MHSQNMFSVVTLDFLAVGWTRFTKKSYECPCFITGCTTVKFAPSFYHVLPKPKPPKAAAEAKIPERTPQKEATGAIAPVNTSKSAPAVTVPKNTGKDCLV